MTNSSRTNSLRTAHLRVARPTERLEELVNFYSHALGFVLFGRFRDHDGFDGVMLGHEGGAYHLEFTTNRGHVAGPPPSPEHLLVFYLPDAAEWREAVNRVESFGVAPVASFNPYWDKLGRTYEDPDGYRIVLQNATWPSGE